MTSFNALADLENLRLFLQERIREVDPSLDTSIGSEIDTTVIQPLLDRLGPDPYDVPVRDFIIGRLQTEFPELVVQDGEPIDDYAVKIMQILLEPFRRQIRQVSNNQSVANPEILNETEADNLGANYFLTRELGSFASGQTRLYYSAPQFSQVAPVNVITTGSGLRFFPVETQAITLDRMLFNVEDNLYYQDVICRAEEQGTDYNIAENTLTSIQDMPAVVRVSNPSPFTGGEFRESTEDFLARVEQSLTEKSLVTLRGIRARLFDVFESIRLIAVTGMGDPEMERDILEGASTAFPYAFGNLSTIDEGGNQATKVDIDKIFLVSDIQQFPAPLKTVAQAGVEAGDTISQFSGLNGWMAQVTVVRFVDADTIEITPNIYAPLTNSPYILSKPDAGITISGIPGGFTGASPINIDSGEVHIGGALDVFVRAGDPQPRNTTLEGILDGSPLHFGVDLESFGANDARLTHLTEPIVDIAQIVNRDIYGTEYSTTKINQVLILTRVWSATSDQYLAPWAPTEDDVGRYIQLLGDGVGGGEYGTFGILSVDGEEYWVDTSTTPYTRYRSVRITIGDETTSDVYDEESGTTRENGSKLTVSTDWDTYCRLVEKLDRKSVIRDRDGSTIVVADAGETDILAGVNFSTVGPNNEGAAVGDSVVIETGDDAGIYSIRRILSWLNTNDSLVLDRALTKTLQPSGTGDGSGLRYRIADELNVDLVSPRVTKIPLDPIFAGDDLDTVAGSETVTVSTSTNFLLAGVEAGDTLEVLEGDNAGQYTVTSVAGTAAVLNTPMATAGFSLIFAVYRSFPGIERPLVRVKTIELLDSNSQPTGITIPYGDAIDGRILGILGNRAEGTEVESFTGVTDTSTNELSDANRDFTAEGVVDGNRVNILNTLNAGEYTVKSVVDANTLELELTADGGLDFRTSESGVHYTVGRPSSGYVRLYFQEPTSIEIDTGLAGGRLETGNDTPREFRFSEVEGYTILPPGGSDDTVLRDLRVVRSEDVGGGDFNTLVELTDTSNPSAFESEILVGDVFAIQEEIQFRNLKALNATYTWNGTTTVTSSDTSEAEVGNYIRLDSDGGWFKITEIDPDTDVTIVGASIPTGSTQSSVSATFGELGISGQPAGLRTVAGSNLVSVPTGSLVNFTAMAGISSLVGQTLYIDDGNTDAGEYIIEEVVGAKELRLNKVMTATTEFIISQGTVDTTETPNRFARLEASGDKVNLTVKSGDNPGAVIERHITLFESTRGDFDGTYQITDVPVSGSTVELDASPTEDIPNPKDLRTLISATDQDDGAITAGGQFYDDDDNLRTAGVKIGDIIHILSGTNYAGQLFIVREHPSSGTGVGAAFDISDITGTAPTVGETGLSYEVWAAGDIDSFFVGRFNWIQTAADVQVEQGFRVYNTAPTEAAVLEVAPVAQLKVGTERGTISTATNKLTDFGDASFASVDKGDLLEILTGPNAGVYPIETVVTPADYVTIYTAHPFFVNESDVPYKIWGGLHGQPRQLKLGPHQSFDGKIEIGAQVPYTLRRSTVFRVSSTEMSENVDNSLYYADIQIESQGSGDELNLPEDTRMVVTSGMRVDGYKYTVENNRLTFSPYEEVSLDFDRRFLPVGNSDSPENLTEVSGRNIKITYEASSVARLVNDLLRSEFDRPINADPIGRHFLPSYVITTFTYSGGTSEDDMGQELEDAINRIGAQEAIRVSDLEAILTRRGATYVQHPITLVSVTHDIDRNLVVDRSEDSLGGPNEVSFNGTGRISAFFAILGEGLTVTKL